MAKARSVHDSEIEDVESMDQVDDEDEVEEEGDDDELDDEEDEVQDEEEEEDEEEDDDEDDEEDDDEHNTDETTAVDNGVTGGEEEDDNDEDDEDEDDEDEGEDAEEEDEDEEEIPSISDDETGYKIEDPDDIDDDLEMPEDDEEDEEDAATPAPTSRTNKVPVSEPTVPPGGRLFRRRQQLSYYEDDDKLDEDEEDDEDEQEEEVDNAIPKTGVTKSNNNNKSRVKKKASKADKLDLLENDLLLSDEEPEYDPDNHQDLSRMTQRQRAIYMEEDIEDTNEEESVDYDDIDTETGTGTPPVKKKRFMELGDNYGRHAKQKRTETEEQAAHRKAENARSRHNYKLKQLEEEKQDTLNKLLKRRAAKTREIQPKEGSVDPRLGSQSLLGILSFLPIRPQLSHPGLMRYVNNVSTLKGNSVLAYNREENGF